MTVEPTRTTAAMECGDLERSLDAFVDGEFDAQERCDAISHLAGCPACRALAEREARIREGLRGCLKRALGPDADVGRAPPALRLRVVAALEQERGPWWRRLLAPVPIGALALCAACAAFVATRSNDDLLVEEAVRRHVRNLPLEVTADFGSPDRVHAWFNGKLDFNPRPPRFAAPDVQLVGGRLSHISDRPAAYMRYHLPRGHVGLFIVEDPQRRFGESGRTVRVGPEEVHLVQARGYNLAVWRHDEILYSLVGDLDEQQLARLVASTSADRR